MSSEPRRACSRLQRSAAHTSLTRGTGMCRPLKNLAVTFLLLLHQFGKAILLLPPEEQAFVTFLRLLLQVEEEPPEPLPQPWTPQCPLVGLALQSRLKAPSITSPVCMWLDPAWPVFKELHPCSSFAVVWQRFVLYALLTLIKQITTCP